MLTLPTNRKFFDLFANFLVFVFYPTLLISARSYSYAPMTLAVFAIIFVIFHRLHSKQKIALDRDSRWLIYAFISYFATILLSVIFTQDGLREIDNPSRVLLFIPLIYLFSQIPLKLNTLLVAIPLGAMTTGLLALYQKIALGYIKAFIGQMTIQSGDISSGLAMMSLAVSIYYGIKKRYTLMAFCLISSILALLASALTGARGGWVGLPIVSAIILFFSYHHFSRKFTLIITLVFALIITGVILNPKTNVAYRINNAKNDVMNYLYKDNRTSSLGARFDMWHSAFLGIEQKPIMGWGKKGYIELKQSQYEQKIIKKYTLPFNDAHNQFIDITVKRGAIGLLGLLAVIFIPLGYFIRQYKNTQIEIKLTALLGIVHIISTLFFFTSQTFLAHNSGSIFYFMNIIIIYGVLKNLNNAAKNAPPSCRSPEIVR